jgi:hypothetical protein
VGGGQHENSITSSPVATNETFHHPISPQFLTACVDEQTSFHFAVSEQSISSKPSFDKIPSPSIRPSDFYRQQHPDYFSDSQVDEKLELGEDQLRFYLEQLTTERREREFEEFARAIAEKEICPNLLPQTGPVGGGDSKTDSSTYPVSEELAERRYWSSQGRPASDDWAFAFSAKKKWQPKMADDVTKIAGLSRRFSKVFFITNQPVPDKDREKWETKMRERHGADVRILDRTWLVERVFKGRHVDLAIAKLGLDVRMSETRSIGPRDAGREVELEKLLQELRNPDLRRTDDYSLAEKYVEAAKLSCSLERPRSEVDGLFLQGRRLASTAGHAEQIVRAHYQHAWRSYFWFDDPKEAERIYEEMEPYLERVGTGEECELFANICSILQTARLFRQHETPLNIETARLDRLKTRLSVLAADESRPNASLYAKTLLVGMRMRKNLGNGQRLAEVLDEYLDCFRAARGLLTYPLLRFMEAIEGVGKHFCILPNYLKFQEEVQQLVAERCGMTEAGGRQLNYGIDLLSNNRAREAIIQISQARFKLAHEETLLESGRASLALGVAYGTLDHLWAARVCFLEAAQIALYSIKTMRNNPKRGYDCVIRLAWTELRLGRIAPFLAWCNFAHGLAHQVAIAGQETSGISEELERQDGCLACLFLKLSKESATELLNIEVTLEAMGLQSARLALLFAADAKQTIEKELSIGPDEVEHMIQSWKEQPAYDQLNHGLVKQNGRFSIIEIIILGVKYRIRCENSIGPQIYAETILGMIESAFADANWKNFAFVVDTVEFLITSGSSGSNPPSIDPSLFGMEVQELAWHGGMIEWMRNKPKDYTTHLHDLLMSILLFTTIDAKDDITRELADWTRNGVFDRACAVGRSFVALLDLIGEDKYDIQHWAKAAVAS